MDPVEYLNDECMLQILEFAAADDCRGGCGRRGKATTTPNEEVVDFFDTTTTTTTVDQGSTTTTATTKTTSKDDWSVRKAVRFYYPLVLVNQGWMKLITKFLNKQKIAIEWDDIFYQEKGNAAIKWLANHQLNVRSLKVSYSHPNALRILTCWMERLNTSQLITTHIDGAVSFLGRQRIWRKFEEILAQQCPNLQNLRIKVFFDVNAALAGFSPVLLSLASIRSVDLIIQKVGNKVNFLDQLIAKFIQNWTGLRNLRLECRQKKKNPSAGQRRQGRNNNNNNHNIVKIESTSLERLCLERFSPWLDTRFDLVGCPNLQEYTLGKPRRRTKQSVVAQEGASDKNDPRCRRVSRPAALRRRRRGRGRGRGRRTGESDSEDDLVAAPPLAEHSIQDYESSDGDDMPPLQGRDRHRLMIGRVQRQAGSSSDEDGTPPPAMMGRPRGPPLAAHPNLNQDNDNGAALPLELYSLFYYDSSSSSSSSWSSDSLEDSDEQEALDGARRMVETVSLL